MEHIMQRLVRTLSVLAMLFTAACADLEKRPQAVALSYTDAAALPIEARNQVEFDAAAKADAFNWRDELKFLNGDAVESRMGRTQFYAQFFPLTQQGLIKIVNDPVGLEGKVTTMTLLVQARGGKLYADITREDGSTVFRDTVIFADLAVSDDIGRLIVAKMGDILAAAANNTGAALISKLVPCNDCGGEGDGVVNILDVEGGDAESVSIANQVMENAIRTGIKSVGGWTTE